MSALPRVDGASVMADAPAHGHVRFFESPVDMAASAAALSLAAAIIHSVAAPAHFDVALVYGLFFVAMTVCQAAWAGWVVRRASPRTWLAGIALNLGIFLVWLTSRTVGVPFGPDAWTRERIGLADALATLFELGVVALALMLVRRRFARRVELGAISPTTRSVVMFLFWLTAGALFVGGGAH